MKVLYRARRHPIHAQPGDTITVYWCDEVIARAPIGTPTVVDTVIIFEVEEGEDFLGLTPGAFGAILGEEGMQTVT